MKKLIYILVAFAVASVSLTSCNDLLEEESFGNLSVEEMMTNEENVVLLIGQAYADLKFVHDHWGYWGVSSLTSDECVCPARFNGSDWSDGGYWKRLNDHTWDISAKSFENIWNITISCAVLCNKVLDTLYKYEESIGDVFGQYVGELEVLRCYYYYLLFDCFGRIPYLENFEVVNEPLMDPEMVWSYLVACLEKNAPNMAVVNDGNRAQHYGRVTQGFAYGLLARLYLNAESFGCTLDNVFDPEIFVANIPELGNNASAEEIAAVKKLRQLPPKYDKTSFYKNCVRCCDEVINSGSYSIESSYFTNFAIDNSASRENIFVTVDDGRDSFDYRSTDGQNSNKLRIIALTLHYCHQEVWGLMETPWCGFCARPEFMELYKDEGDVRGAGPYGESGELALGTNETRRWGWFVGPVYKADGKTPAVYVKKDEKLGDLSETVNITKNIRSLDDASYNDGARLLKYEVAKNDSKNKWAENDFVLMRYVDILWMKEEAIKWDPSAGVSGINGVSAADFNTLMSRSFAYESGDPKAKFIEVYGNPTGWTLEQILDERGREMTWEMVRRRDLIRHDKFDQIQYVENRDIVPAGSDGVKMREWFPIPFSVLEKAYKDPVTNKRLWTQNPGYDNPFADL